MTFARPQLLWLLLLLPVALGLAWLAAVLARRALAQFAGGAEHAARFAGEVSPHRRAVKALLLGLALVSGLAAAARPQWGVRLEEVRREGVDVAIVLDTSLSMAAEDVSPSRLGLARQAVDTLLERLGGDRVALIGFAARATVTCPLTVDHGAVALFLDAMELESGPVAGTSLADAVRVALRALGQGATGGTGRGRAIVLLSDGEDHEGGVDEVLDEVERSGVAVYALGLGTVRGAPIPLAPEAGGASGYKTDADGRVVTTRLDEATLERLALATRGRYYRATAGQLELEEVVNGIHALEAREFGSVLRARYEERFQWPLLLAFAALAAETLLGDRARRRDGEVGIR